MKRQITITLAGGAALLLCGSGFAEPHKGLIDSSKLDRHNITDLHGNQLGHLESLLLDPVTGTVQYAMIGTGLITDNADPDVAVPWSAFKLDRSDPNEFKLTLDATKEKLANAPKLTGGEAGGLFNQAGSDAIRTYWADPLKAVAADTAPATPGTQKPATTGVGSNPPEFSKGDSKNYYERNRPMLAPSGSGPNNSPAGFEGRGPAGNVSTPIESTAPAPGTSPKKLPDQTARALDQAADLTATPAPPSKEKAAAPDPGLTVP